MRIRHLRLRVNTDKGLHGTDIDFPDGLVVLWADNSMGKSTCIRSILVALGFEAAITTNQRDLPLPPVMKTELESSDGLAKVIESNIYVEIENLSGERIAVQRTVKGSRDKNLVTVSQGPALTDPGRSYPAQDYFVSRSGAAARERGFHRFLAEFLGWSLPIVQTFEGREYPLYIQCLIPYFAVEQTRGWANIDPPIPTQFRLREPHKRALEFLLDLDARRIARRRIELEEEKAKLQSQWASIVAGVRKVAQSMGGVTSGLPIKPVSSWPPEIAPSVLLPRDDEWIAAGSLLEEMKSDLRELTEEEIPRVSEAADAAEVQLTEMQADLRRRESVLERLLESLELERGEVDGVRERLEKIGEDLQRNKDVRTLVNLGSEMAPSIAEGICPACHQNLEDSLAPVAEGQSVMSVEENIGFLEGQRATFLAVQRNAQSIVEARQRQVARLREKLARDRSEIRALKETLVSDSRLPSKAAIQRQIELQQRIDSIGASMEHFDDELAELEDLSNSWSRVQSEISRLPKHDTSATDRRKIERWSSILQDELHEYDFQSLPVDSIYISQDSYRPSHEGFDLPSNISASDFIRVIWSYLTGLLELSREFNINHPGVLILDEPKQQSAKELSFESLLLRASQAGAFGEQIIFATSETQAVLERMIVEIPHTYISFDGRIIRSL